MEGKRKSDSFRAVANPFHKSKREEEEEKCSMEKRRRGGNCTALLFPWISSFSFYFNP